MSSNAKNYIARSALATFLLEVAQSFESGIEMLTVEFADPELTNHGCNWVVTNVGPGTTDPYRACCVVATVERANSGWVMVEDGSALDGQVVERPEQLH